MDENEQEFGLFLGAVAERDVDLLLLEEFHVSAEFTRWFCSKLDIGPVEFRGAWHSVSDSTGETDLLLLVQSNGIRIGVLIENKIGAAEQDAQGQRYHIRGTRAQEAGKFDRFVTCMCAPENYLAHLPADSPYQYRLSYEAVSAWFEDQKDARSLWKRHVIQKGIDQSRRGYTMVVSPVTTRFQSEYWEYRRQYHPEILMNKPGPKGAGSTWIILKGPRFPKAVNLHHKLDHSVIELGFDGRFVSDLQGLGIAWPPGVTLVQKGKTAALSISISEIRVEKDVASQQSAMEEAFAAMKKLVPFATVFERDGKQP